MEHQKESSKNQDLENEHVLEENSKITRRWVHPWRLKVAPLFKPIRRPLFSGMNFKCYMVTVLYGRRRNKRFFLNLTRYYRLMPKVLSTVLNTLRWKNWHTFFMLTTAREFERWRLRYPMRPITFGIDSVAVSKTEQLLKRLWTPRPKAKRREANGRKNRNGSLTNTTIFDE
ncbi:hypothetical protein KR026_011723 [Drosophila bipectinata]|nr:hypothetical protein KR026_011723 [Drosophila bipectinata]